MLFFLFISYFIPFFHEFYFIVFYLFMYMYLSFIWCRQENVRITDWEQTQFSTHKFTDKIEGFVHRVF
jgi:hypothetical protein